MAALTPVGEALVLTEERDWVGPRYCLDIFGERDKSLAPARIQTLYGPPHA